MRISPHCGDALQLRAQQPLAAQGAIRRAALHGWCSMGAGGLWLGSAAHWDVKGRRRRTESSQCWWGAEQHSVQSAAHGAFTGTFPFKYFAY